MENSDRSVHMTADGKVLKGVDLVEAIYTKYEERTKASCLYWQNARILRRDFNLLTAKMFFKTRNPKLRGKIWEMIRSMQDEAERLTDMARKYEMPTGIVAAPVPVRLISREAKAILEAIATADRAWVKMNRGGMGDEASDCLGPFLSSFGKIKRYVVGSPRAAIKPAPVAASIQIEPSALQVLIKRARTVQEWITAVIAKVTRQISALTSRSGYGAA